MEALFRFRDLSCPENETILRHKDIIHNKGHVYWGWWNKGHEKLPLHTLQNLQLFSKPQKVYLFDSAQKIFFVAECEVIKCDLGGRIETPDRDATPAYYLDTKCLMWLKLTSIDEVAQDLIVGMKSYCEMSDLFTNDNHYDIFNDKIIYDGSELSEQNRTIWLIRNKLSTDKQHKIMLSTLSSIEPRHFDKSVNYTHRDSILWISDPHFTNNGKHGFSLGADTAQTHTLATTLRDAFGLAEMQEIATLMISGDFTWSAEKEEFGLTERFLSDICSMASLDKSWIGFCPGNHDLAFHTDDMEKLDPINISANCAAAKSNYSELYKKFFHLEPNEHLSSGRRFILGATKPVEIVYLNSVVLQQIKESFQGFGFVGQQQLTHVAKEMRFRKKKPRNLTRICVMHHHLIPVSLSEHAYDGGRYSTVLDSERLSRWLSEYEFDFLLHGHMHQNFHCKIERSQITHQATSDSNKKNTLNVLSLGSSGVISNHTGEPSGNWVCKITFTDEEILFNYKKISPQTANPGGDYELRFPYND